MRFSDSDSIGGGISRNGDSIPGFLGINTSAVPTDHKLQVNNPILDDSLAEVMITCSSASQKGLVVQRFSNSQTANIFEVQNISGADFLNVSAGGIVSASSGFTFSGQFRMGRQGITTASATISVGSTIVGVTSTTTTAVALTLPAASNGSTGNPCVYFITDEGGNAATNNITITHAGSDTVDGATNYVINANYGSVLLYGYGTTWFTLSKT